MVTGVVAALLAGYGTYLIYTAFVLGRRGLGPGRRRADRPVRRSMRQRLEAAGGRDVDPAQLAAAMLALAVVGAAGAFALFGGAVPALVTAAFAATFPLVGCRARYRRRVQAAQDAWPRMLEELRLLTGSVGRSIPQALFEVGRRAPEELRPAFAMAEREWLLTLDFDRTAGVLKDQLADSTADVVCETLVVANEVGGGGIDRRLAELIEDRILDSQGRKDAESKQAGVRFARRFVLLVPLGMAVAGLSIGTGRAAYETASGQLFVVVGIGAVIVCWLWSGRLMRVPGEPRVFAATSARAEGPPVVTGGLRGDEPPFITPEEAQGPMAGPPWHPEVAP